MIFNQNKAISAVLAFLSLISVFAMLHHPSVSSVEVAEQITEINREATTNSWVHGFLIALLVSINLCLTQYGKLRGLNHSTVLFGLIFYWLGSVIMILAALMSGIVGPEVAAYYTQANNNDLQVFRGLFILKSEMNQAFANCAVFCWNAAMLCWGLEMLTREKFTRLFGAASIIVAALTAIALVAGWIRLGVAGMTLILIVISIWQLGIARQLYVHPKL